MFSNFRESLNKVDSWGFVIEGWLKNKIKDMRKSYWSFGSWNLILIEKVVKIGGVNVYWENRLKIVDLDEVEGDKG